MKIINAKTLLFVLGGLTLFAFGCGRKTPQHTAEDHASAHTHEHPARHGGVVIELGEEEAHIELTYGNAKNTIQAYFFDGEMENYIRVAMPSFNALAVISGQNIPLTFNATASHATGESIGDSSLFEAQTALPEGPLTVQLTIPGLTVRGRSYKNLSATLPARQ